MQREPEPETMAEKEKQHIDRIRRTKFSIGGEENPLTEDLHQAVKNLSAELYAKDVHFLLELIQNAEDNEYPEGVDPSLEFVITSEDITATGAPATLLIFNNERGFSEKNIESICSVGRSTKKGNRKSGYIGEKGIGFKSVFLITSQPYIFSNGYQIRFDEAPCSHCSLGYIVPEWVHQHPSPSDIHRIYGSASALPTTTIILPLKSDKVKPVKEQLSCVHPEVLLFLSKIKRLSIREHCQDPKLSTVNSIGIVSETNFVTRKSIDAESYTIHLSASEKGKNSEKECSYYMWRQKFPVKHENRVERRSEVEDWVITLAFPFGERLGLGTSSPGIYAFLPTEMVTNFPFIMQADFILASSRETILLDDIWNQGILNCVPLAFVNAFTSLVKKTDAPVSSLVPAFRFLPVEQSSYAKLNVVRESIITRVLAEEIVPSVSHLGKEPMRTDGKGQEKSKQEWKVVDKANAGLMADARRGMKQQVTNPATVLSALAGKLNGNTDKKVLQVETITHGKAFVSTLPSQPKKVVRKALFTAESEGVGDKIADPGVLNGNQTSGLLEDISVEKAEQESEDLKKLKAPENEIDLAAEAVLSAVMEDEEDLEGLNEDYEVEQDDLMLEGLDEVERKESEDFEAEGDAVFEEEGEITDIMDDGSVAEPTQNKEELATLPGGKKKPVKRQSAFPGLKKRILQHGTPKKKEGRNPGKPDGGAGAKGGNQPPIPRG